MKIAYPMKIFYPSIRENVELILEVVIYISKG